MADVEAQQFSIKRSHVVRFDIASGGGGSSEVSTPRNPFIGRVNLRKGGRRFWAPRLAGRIRASIGWRRRRQDWRDYGEECWVTRSRRGGGQPRPRYSACTPEARQLECHPPVRIALRHEGAGPRPLESDLGIFRASTDVRTIQHGRIRSSRVAHISVLTK
jgi:hypothetical protein